MISGLPRAACLCLALAVPGVVGAHTEASISNYTSRQADFLERYNQPELFLADMKNLDVRPIDRKSNGEAVYTRLDGVKVRIMTTDSMMGRKGMYYLKDLAHPASAYRYRNIYNEFGVIVYKVIVHGKEPYRAYLCKDGNCVPDSSHYEITVNSTIPVEQTRAMLRKKTGIDLYDKSRVDKVSYLKDKSIPYHIRIMQGQHHEMLIDAKTARTLYERNVLIGFESNASTFGKKEELLLNDLYYKHWKILTKHMKIDSNLVSVYKKHSAQEQGRLYEVFLEESDISILLDHRKEGVIHQIEVFRSFPHWQEESVPYVKIWDEYQQHLKMRKAEEEDPGPRRAEASAPEQAAFLERYNQPELFLADVKNLNVQQIAWTNRRESEAAYTRPDGVEVRIDKRDDDYVIKKKGLHYEYLNYSASPYYYRNIYDETGILLYKEISFYNHFLGRYECKDGKCAVTPLQYNMITEVEQTRAALRKETGIDLYDKSLLRNVHHITNKPYYVLMVHEVHHEMVIDAQTGKVLYERGTFVDDETLPSTNMVPGTIEVPESAAYLKSTNIVKEHMKENQAVYSVYKKDSARYPNRFYEVIVTKPPNKPYAIMIIASQFVSFLLDHKTGKILYQCEMSILTRNDPGPPYIWVWDEYQQYVKMREAEGT
jgi:uncharacterized membrane protein YkoI